MKKAILTGMVLMLFLLPSCVSPEEYAQVSSDLSVAQSEIETLQAQLAAKENELAIAQKEIEDLQNELATKEIELDQLKARTEILLYISLSEEEREELHFDWKRLVIATGDLVLLEKHNAIEAELFEPPYFAVKTETLTEFFIYFRKSTYEILHRI